MSGWYPSAPRVSRAPHCWASLFSALRQAPYEVPREMRIAASIHWYQQGTISMERAAETAGMDRPQFLAELARRRVDVFVIDEEDLSRELKSV